MCGQASCHKKTDCHRRENSSRPDLIAAPRRYSRLSRDSHTDVVAGLRRYSRLSRDSHTDVVAGLRRYSRLSRDSHTDVVAGLRRYSRLSRDSTNRSSSSHARTASAYGGAGLLAESESRTEAASLPNGRSVASALSTVLSSA
jgi:hypothetical protein